RAIEFEINRQKKLVNKGHMIEQQTRLWDENSQKTYLMRTKEDSQDYRYFPDPDLIPLILTDHDIDSIKAHVPLLPLERKIIYEKEYSLTSDEARLLMINPVYADFLKETIGHYDKPRTAANWFFNEILSYVAATNTIPLKPLDFAMFLKKIDNHEISGKIGKNVIKMGIETGKKLIDIIEEKGMRQITDTEVIQAAILQILDKHKEQVEMYKSGKTEIYSYFVGQVMKATKGKANPGIVNTLLKELLEKK
ncbi:MAG: hypothetical protein JXJ04_06180, partial [Spirochaetales bacterium]|nr:hypothetical protein [Spirochaetales bacterium]